jgi:hypothetical protein
MDAALNTDNSSGSRQADDGIEEVRGGIKGIGRGVLQSLGRKKGKEEDPETGNRIPSLGRLIKKEDDPKSGKRIAAWVGNLASKPGGG